MSSSEGMFMATSVETPLLLTSEAAAQLMSISPATLRLWRHKGRGPAYVRISTASVKYRLEDIQAWIAAHRVTTSESGVA